MKTVEERAEYICDKLDLSACGLGYWVILDALREQDKITRHACAEACRLAGADSSESLIGKAYSDICMSVKAV